MLEYAPIVLGAIVGAVGARYATARTHKVLGIAIVVVVALTATLVSGEYRENWLFAILDLAEVALGTVIAFALAAALERRRTASR